VQAMTVERNQRRMLWMNLFLSLIPDAAIAYAVMRLTESGWVVFAIVFFGLWGLYLAIWLKNSIWSWLVFLLWGRRQRAATFVSGFRAGEFPEPDEFEKSADAYLERLVNDEAASVKVRLMAMSDVARLRMLNDNGFQAFLQVSLALDDALEQYKNQFPPKASALGASNQNVAAAEGAEGDEAEDVPGDDAEAQIVAQVQATCQTAAMIAGNQDNPNERRRFEARITKALDLAKGIRDEFYRSSAFHRIVSTLIKDNQLDRVQELISEITVDFIRERAQEELRAARR
jgi:hypothetical protein